MFLLRESRSTWFLYALLLAILTLISFGSLREHPFATDDFDYLSDAAAVRQDLSRLLSADQALPGRPVVSLLFLLANALWGTSPAPYHLLLVGLHLAASLMLAFSFRRLGANLELSLLGGLLFSINVAHFRAVQWISCLAYPLVLLFGLATVLLFARFLDCGRRRWLAAAVALITLAIFTHAAAISAALFCAYLAWRRGLHARAVALSAGPLCAVAALGTGLMHLLYPHAPQSKTLLVAPGPMLLLGNLFDALSRCFTAAHWLFSYETASWEWLTGLLIGAGFVLLLSRRLFPAADWAVWSVLALLPFIVREEHDLSRYLYLATAGTSFLLAWLLHALMVRLERWLAPSIGRLVGGAALVGLIAASFIYLQRAEAISFYCAGRSYAVRGDQQTSLELLKRAIARDPQQIPQDAYLRLAVAGFLFGESSQEILTTALAAHHNSPELRMLLGAAAFLGQDAQRRQQGDQQVHAALARAADPDQLRNHAALAFHHIGLYHNTSGRSTLAIPAFKRAIKLQPDYAPALAGLGQAYATQKQTQKALAAYRIAVQLRPDLAKAQHELALLLLEQDDYPGATTALEHAVASDPTSSSSWYMLAQMRRVSGDLDAAYQATLRALAGDSSQTCYWYEYCRIANLYHTRGQLDHALAIYKNVVRALPSHASVHYNLGLIHYAEGRHAEAVAALRKAVALSPDDAQTRLALEQASMRLHQNPVSLGKISDLEGGMVAVRY